MPDDFLVWREWEKTIIQSYPPSQVAYQSIIAVSPHIA
ncbi:MAG: hypothetical protein QG657_4642 [Acidobacteriota bacterium]|nr:hypothetical protein [Acidobacteriota bacterium]